MTSEFQEVVKQIHTRTNWVDNFELELAKKLISKGLNKTQIAYLLAQKLEEEFEDAFIVDDNVKYLVDAIKYACND